METVGIIEIKKGGVVIHPDYEVGDSIIAYEVLEAMGLQQYNYMLRTEFQKIHDVESGEE